MIRLRDVRHRYGARDAWALDGVSLDLAAGEALGVAGAPGTGKTTLLRVIATLIEPAEGTVTIEDVDAVMNPESARRHIGYAPHDLAPTSARSVEALLGYVADAWGVDRRVVGDVLELVELRDRATRAPATLSTGERRRLALAQCLVHDPMMLVLDDPLSDLDGGARQWLADLCGELRSLGKTLVLSAPDPELLAGVCERVVTLERGHLIIGQESP